MNKIPFFSILMPVYNAEDFVEESIDSVIGQSFRDYELIIVDDGSTDRSGAICDKYAENDARVKVIHKPNGGSISARCTAINECIGSYVVFVDADDTLKSDALSKLHSLLESNNCDCLIFGYDTVLDNSVIGSTSEPEDVILLEKRDAYKKLFYNSSYNALWRKVTKRTAFDGRSYEEYYKYSMGDDLLQSLEILENSNKFMFVKDRFYNYRVNQASITHTLDYNKYDFSYRIYEFTLQYLLNCGVLSKEDIKAYRTYCSGLIVTDIIKINKSELAFSTKKKCLEKIRCSKYFSQLTSDKLFLNELNLKQRALLILFQLKLYKCVLLLA